MHRMARQRGQTPEEEQRKHACVKKKKKKMQDTEKGRKTDLALTAQEEAIPCVLKRDGALIWGLWNVLGMRKLQ